MLTTWHSKTEGEMRQLISKFRKYLEKNKTQGNPKYWLLRKEKRKIIVSGNRGKRFWRQWKNGSTWKCGLRKK